AIERGLARQVAVDLAVREPPECDVRGDQPLVAPFQARVPDAKRGMEEHRMAAHLAQLAARMLDSAGLADGASVEVRHLVRADHPGERKLAACRLGLGTREPNRGLPGRLTDPRSFVDVRTSCFA